MPDNPPAPPSFKHNQLSLPPTTTANPPYPSNLQQQHEPHHQLLGAPQQRHGEPAPLVSYHLHQLCYPWPATPYPANHAPVGIQPAAHHATPTPAALKRKRPEEADTDTDTLKEPGASPAGPEVTSSDGYSKKRADIDSEVLRVLIQQLEHVLQNKELAPNYHHCHSASFMLRMARVACVADEENWAIRFVQSATAARLLNSGNKFAGPLVFD